ncbi:hypothetical protein [Microbacterium sp. Root180]|uniref:hypothetical protein n=1 Tax=Microbacterium sp. Root180 TaxID=1736483 RepID=UPI0006F8F92B|nr:hypothetical protein [Microbacterium sp. Root180]KRB36407.1 hypothetical protein ASD93_10040 [Microbacterium sp. Root180]
MTVPETYESAPQPTAGAGPSSLVRAAIWVAIGALIAAALVCVVWVLIGGQNDIVGRAFLTILLLVAFAGATILDAHLAPRRPAWFALASMGAWIAALLIGAVMIWMPERYSWGGFSRFVQFLFIVLILQLVLLHVRLYLKAFQRYDTTFTRSVAIVTIILVVALATLLIIPLMLGEYLWFPDIYWRVTVAVAILAALGTALIPLVNVLFAPKRPRAAAPYAAPYGAAPVPYAPQLGAPPAPAPAALAPAAPAAPTQQELLPWPTYVDGSTPLPMLPDGSPDWGAYYTGYPTPGAHVFVAPEHDAATSQTDAAPSAAPGYEGFPPPPPLPPRP